MINKVSDAYKKNLFYLIVGPLLKQIEAIFDRIHQRFPHWHIEQNKRRFLGVFL